LHAWEKNINTFSSDKSHGTQTPPPGRMFMKVKIDYDLCTDDGHCCELCPEVFQFDDDHNKLIVVEDEISVENEDLVRQAADDCDTGAILIRED
jgi:ferredoxin